MEIKKEVVRVGSIVITVLLNIVIYKFVNDSAVQMFFYTISGAILGGGNAYVPPLVKFPSLRPVSKDKNENRKSL